MLDCKELHSEALLRELCWQTQSLIYSLNSILWFLEPQSSVSWMPLSRPWNSTFQSPGPHCFSSPWDPTLQSSGVYSQSSRCYLWSLEPHPQCLSSTLFVFSEHWKGFRVQSKAEPLETDWLGRLIACCCLDFTVVRSSSWRMVTFVPQVKS